MTNKHARPTTLNTPHGIVKLPAFLPDATYGYVQGVSNADLTACGINELVTTTLHIEQKIGSDFLAQAGGIHKFTGWSRPILTDSGGFQVFSLIYRNQSKQNMITDAGCSFVDPLTGKYNFISPEISQQIQYKINSDIRVVLDEPVFGNASLASIKKSVDRTTKWAARSKAEFLKLYRLTEDDFNNPEIERPLLCAVIQGGNNLEMRKESLQGLLDIGFDIYGLGGMPLRTIRTWDLTDMGGFHKELLQMLAEQIPTDKLRYALGVGTPDDLIFCAQLGWDIFDTVLPTRNARHAYIYVHSGEGDTQYQNYDVLHLKSERYKLDDNPIDTRCDCLTCRSVGRSYLRYLLRNKSSNGQRLATIHNLHFYAQIMQQLSRD